MPPAPKALRPIDLNKVTLPAGIWARMEAEANFPGGVIDHVVASAGRSRYEMYPGRDGKVSIMLNIPDEVDMVECTETLRTVLSQIGVTW